MTASAAYFIHISQTIFAALYSVCVWDWLTSLPREWYLIWKSRWSTVKVLYLLCRYWIICVTPYILWVLLTNHSESECQKLFRSTAYLAMWNQIWAECVLMVRAYAFLGNRLPVLAGLIGLLCAVVGYQVWVITIQMALLQEPFKTSLVGPCFPTVTYPKSPHLMLFFVVPLIYDIIATLLTLFRAWQLRQRVGDSSPLLKTFVTEGLYYFVLISGVNLMNAVFYWQPNKFMSAMLVSFSAIFPDVLACRMILSLRDSATGQGSGHNTSGFYTHSARRIAGGKPPPRGAPAHVSDIVFASTSSKDIGIITSIGYNHELTTFHQKQHVVGGDSDSVDDSGVKTIPYEVDDTPPPDDIRAAAGIRIDVESHNYYEERTHQESYPRRGMSFTP